MLGKSVQFFHLLVAVTVGSLVAIALSSATLLIPTHMLQDRIVHAFRDSALVTANYLGDDSRRGRYSVNDCLILHSLMVGRDDWRKLGLLSTVLMVADEAPCSTLENFVTGKISPARKQGLEYPYARYFFAAKAFTGFGLALLPIDELRQTLRGVIYLLLVISLSVSIVGLWRGGKHTPLLYLTVALGSLGWLSLYDLWYYSPTLAHAFSEIVLVGFLAYSVLADPPRSRHDTLARAVALFILTAWFELLTGPTLLAAALAVMIGFAHNPNGQRSLKDACEMWLLGLFTVSACLLSLQAINSFITGCGMLAEFFTHLAIRADLHHLLELSIDERWRVPTNLVQYSVLDSWLAVSQSLHMLTYGSKFAANVVFGLSGLALCIATLVGMLSARHRPVLIYTSVGLSLVVWYALLPNHTVIHAWAIVRMMVLLPIAAALACLVQTRWGGFASTPSRLLLNK